MNELALFAGAGGGILGGILSGFTTVCAVEKEPYCREVLLRRQRDGVLPLFPIWDDVTTFDGRPWRGLVDVVTAGFPCQPFSVAGQRRGAEDERNLWPDTIRVIREVAPRYAFLENSPNLLAHDYFGEILGSLEEAGFDAEWDVVSAAEVGAWHLRERLWIVAVANGRGWPRRRKRRAMEEQAIAGASPDAQGEQVGIPGQPRLDEGVAAAHAQRSELRDEPGGRCRPGWEVAAEFRDDGTDRPYSDADDDGAGTRAGQRAVPNASGQRRRERGAEPAWEQGRPNGSFGSWWNAEPGVGRVVHGLAHRVDRIRALGNGQVPRVAYEAWCRLRNADPEDR